VKPLMVSHELLYDAILSLHPESLQETGCGAGDHFATLQSLNPSLKCNEAELLAGQLESLNARHLNNGFELLITDATTKKYSLPNAETVFMHAIFCIFQRKNQDFRMR
jgi:hypothetical protein